MKNFDELSEQSPGSIILQLRGMFYNAFEESAVVLSEVTGYKLKPMQSGTLKCGFPANALEKNIELFKKKNISFKVYENGIEEYSYLGATDNFYNILNKHSFKKEEYHIMNIEKEKQQGFQKVTFECPTMLVKQLETIAKENWIYSKDAIISELLKKGISEYGKQQKIQL